MSQPDPRVRSLFLDDEGHFGCAETALVVMQERYALPDAGDSSPALALNGGIAYRGGTCGAITGAALAVGRLAASRIPDHREAKRTARTLVQQVMTGFQEAFGAIDCRTLTGYDMITDHEAFMADGTWRNTCTRQIEFVVGRLAGLADPGEWETAVAALHRPA